MAEATKSLDSGELESLETIDPTPPPPWEKSESIEITINPDRSQALEITINPSRSQALDMVAELIEDSEAVIYTDASEKHSKLGAAV